MAALVVSLAGRILSVALKKQVQASNIIVLVVQGLHGVPDFSISELPLRCLHNIYHYEIPEQSKGNDDHLLPLGDWFVL